MSLSTVACFGQNINENRLFYIEKSNNNAYYLNSYDLKNQTIQSSTPLDILHNLQNSSDLDFQGLCTYADDSSSFYLSFKNAKNNTSRIYQLPANQLPSLKETSVAFNNADLFSIQYIKDATNQPQLAYVATLSNQQKTFGIVNINNSTQNPTDMSISELGMLTATSSHLYLLQNNSIDVYRLAEGKHHHATLSTHLFNTTQYSIVGPVFIASSMNYIPLYYPNTGELKVVSHNTSLTQYSTMPIVNGQISFGSQNTQITNPTQIKNSTQITNPTQAANATQSTSSILPKSTSTIEAAPRMEATPRPDPKRLQRFCKRSVTPTTENTSFQDTSYSLQSFKITNPNSDSPPNAVLLQSRADSSSSSNTLPFDFGSIAVGDNHTTAFSTQNGASSPGKSVNHDASTSALSAGAIVGIVLGSIAFVLLIVILLICLKRRRSKKQRKLKTREMLRAYCGSKDYKGDTLLPSNLQQLHKMTSKDSYSRSAVDIQDMKDILDDARPDIQPLCYTKDAIDYAELPDQELIQLEPDVKGPLYLFNGLYMSSENEQVCRIMDGYVTRTFQSDDGNKHTVHYFSNTHAHTFIRSVYAALRISLPEKTTYTVRSERAIVLGSPTPYSGYRYLWISSPVMPDHSLHHLLFEDNVWSFIDHHSADYKIWSVYAILKSVESVHHQDFVHLAIEPKHFYFDHEMNATDWHLGNFGYAHALSIQQSPSLPIPTSYSAPELVQADGSSAFLATSSDIWSLGCVIYTIVTGGLVLFNSADQLKELLKTDGMKHHLEKAMQGTIENHVFAKILDMMLCVDPKERKAIDEIIAYWHSVYNMEE